LGISFSSSNGVGSAATHHGYCQRHGKNAIAKEMKGLMSGLWSTQWPPLTLPPCSLKHELVILPYTLNSCPHGFSIGRLEAKLLRSKNCMSLHPTVAPSGYPRLLLFVKVDTSDTTSALIGLWTPKLAVVLKLLVEENCSGSALFELTSLR